MFYNRKKPSLIINGSRLKTNHCDKRLVLIITDNLKGHIDKKIR